MADFVTLNLKATEIVKRALQFECDEARYALKPWSLDTVVTQKVDESHCVCKVLSLEAQDKNIADEIDIAIRCAQKLRQISNSNSKIKSQEEQEKVATKKVTEKKTDERKSETSKKKHSINFIAANKKNIKEISQMNKKENMKRNKTQTEQIPNSSKLASNVNKEINTLVEKLSELPSAATKVISQQCPYHNTNFPQIIEKHVIKKVNVKEALNIIRISTKLNKIFKLHHSFWEMMTSDECLVSEEEEANKDKKQFRLMFDTLKQESQDFVPQKLVHLLNEVNVIFEQSSKTNMDYIEKSQLSCRFTSLDTVIKNYCWNKRYKFQEFKDEYSKNVSLYPKIELINNGIWNLSIVPLIQGIFPVNVFCYSDRKQLILIFTQLQKLQRLKYREDLITIIKNIIKSSKEFANTTSENHLLLYKLSITATQVLNLKTPVFYSIKNN